MGISEGSPAGLSSPSCQHPRASEPSLMLGPWTHHGHGGGSCSSDRGKAAAPGFGPWTAAAQGRPSCRAHSPSTVWWALLAQPGAHPHQALGHPPCLLCLRQVLELLPFEELCYSHDSFLGGLQGRSWEVAPGPVEGDLGFVLGVTMPLGSWDTPLESILRVSGALPWAAGIEVQSPAGTLVGTAEKPLGTHVSRPWLCWAAAELSWSKQGRGWKWPC